MAVPAVPIANPAAQAVTLYIQNSDLTFSLAQGAAGVLATSGGGGGGGGGAITAASGSYAAGALSAGSVASGAVAAGAVAAGALVAGAAVDGWDITAGAKGDAAYAGSGSASEIAILKGLYAALIAALPSGANTIGNVGGIGTAGTPSGGVVSVQGVAGGTAQPVSGTVTANPGASVPTAATATSIAAGGTATTLATAPWKSLFIQNPLSLGDQNIAAAETLYINLVTTATANGRGSNILLAPGDSFVVPAMASGNLSAIAATTAHAVSIEVFV